MSGCMRSRQMYEVRERQAGEHQHNREHPAGEAAAHIAMITAGLE
jgi:hypothetical protein